VQASWQVKHLRNVTWTAAPPDAAAIQLTQPGQVLPHRPFVVTPSDAGAPVDAAAWNAAYVGADYPLRAAWLHTALPRPTGDTWEARWQSGYRPWLRWLLYREAAAPAPESVALWAPAE
jgi:hypothetical protein